jgi:predicted O-methyltransferase YrrM
VVTADVAAKSLRKAQAAIREAGVDGVAVILQGALAAGDEITEAGLSAQPKAPKAVA